MAAVRWFGRPPLPPGLADLERRAREVLFLAGITGALTGLVVALSERLTASVLLDRVLQMPLPLAAAAPVVGMVGGFAARRVLARGASPATADEYIRNFHDRTHRLDLRPVVGRLVAAVTTLGLGGPLGYEGPAIYAGAAVGSTLQRRLRRILAREEPKLLMVAGAAAGVAAIFKAPVTGLVFALEVPYTDDLARRMLLPAAISAAAGYATFAAFAGTAPLLPVGGQPPFDFVDLGGSAAVGLAAGLGARLFTWAVRRAKDAERLGHPWARAAGAGAVLGLLFLAGRAAAGQNLTLGPGYDLLRWALAPDRSLPLVAAAAALRLAATATTLAGGGTGGLFVPLVVQGALVGRLTAGLFNPASRTLFPLVGIAAFLGAGYRVPLAAVVFVAEATGRPGFVVPGVVAAVVAQLVCGRASVSPYQRGRQVSPVLERLRLPLAAVVDTEARTVPSDATLEELFWQHLVGGRQRSVPVVDASTYRGTVRADDLAGVARERWHATTVGELARHDVPVATPDWRLADAVRAMEDADTDILPVCDDGRFVGVVRASDVVRLDEVIDLIEPDHP